MLNFVTFALGLFSGFPKPNLVSFDIGSVQVGGGVVLSPWSTFQPYPFYSNLLLLPDLGLSIGQTRMYWGKRTAFVGGFELMRMEAGSEGFGTSEFMMPEIGLARILGQEQNIKSKACMNLFGCESFVPRMEITLGFSPVNTALLRNTANPISFSPTIKSEAKVLLTRSLQVILENRNAWIYDTTYQMWSVPLHTFHLSLCLALGADYEGSNQDIKNEQIDSIPQIKPRTMSSGIPRPSLVSFDVASIQTGAGLFTNKQDTVAVNQLAIPDFGLSLGMARLYWGRNLCFAAGLQILRVEMGFRGYDVGSATSEVLSPEIGLSYLSGPERHIRSATYGKLFKRDSFVPRLDLICGFSPLNLYSLILDSGSHPFYPTIRTEARFYITRFAQIVFENRNILLQGYTPHTFHLSLCFSLGADHTNSNK